MDYKEEINKAAKHYGSHATSQDDYGKLSYQLAWERGALSDKAKAYWYNEFKQTISVGIYEQSKNVPIHKIPHDCPDLKYLIDGSYEKYKEYLKDNPDRPISFDNWKYMVEHYEKPELLSKHDIDDVVNGKRPHYPYGTIQSDPLYGATKKDFDDATPKRIGIIGHVDHGKSITGKIIIVGETGVDDRMVASAHNIQSIVPIADIIPEKIQLTSFYDKISVPKEWDTRKQKKVSHKRNNKRK